MTHATPPPASTSPATVRRVLVALRRIIRTVDIHSRTLARDSGLTGPQLLVLREVAERRSPTTGELAKAVHLSQATMTGIIDRLERKGLVARTRLDRDRRKIRIVPTATTGTALADAPPLLQEHFSRAFALLDPIEQSGILAALERLVSLMEAGQVDAAPVLLTHDIDLDADEIVPPDTDDRPPAV